MLKSLRKFSMLAAVVLSLAAAGSAHAGLSDTFVASDGKVFQTHSVISVEKGAGVIYVKQASGTVQPFADATGSVWLKVAATMNYTTRFVKVPGTDRWINVNYITEISCISNQTVFGYPTSTQPEWFQDSCALHTAVKNLSN